MADPLETPQYSLPFRLGPDGMPVCHEQDSEDDIVQNAVVALRYRQGQRSAMPKYGLPDQALRMGGADMGAIAAAVTEWEPDADIEVIRTALEDDGVDHILVDLEADNG